MTLLSKGVSGAIKSSSQVAVRVRRNGHTPYSVLVTNASPHLLAQIGSFSRFHPHLKLVQVVYAYDKRAGGPETHHDLSLILH